MRTKTAEAVAILEHRKTVLEDMVYYLAACLENLTMIAAEGEAMKEVNDTSDLIRQHKIALALRAEQVAKEINE